MSHPEQNRTQVPAAWDKTCVLTAPHLLCFIWFPQGLLQPRENVPGGITTSCLWEGLEREEVVPRRNREGPGAWGSPNGGEENIPMMRQHLS